MIPVRIAGLGFYLPERCVSSAELEQQLNLKTGWIERVTGVRERRYVTHESTAEMAATAARMALEHAGLLPSDLDAIIGASSAPQQSIPCTAVYVQRLLRVPDGGSVCFDINATCLSFYAALQTAAQLVAAGVYRHVLIFSSETSAWSRNPHEPESAVLFGDAAAAAIITRSGSGEASALWHARMTTASSGSELTTLRGGGSLHHPNDPATTPEMNMFHMDGPGVFRMAVKLLGPYLDTFFTELPWERGSIDAVVPHQASRFGLKQLTARFGFRQDQLVSNLAVRGNCIAASTPLALAEAVHSGRIVRGNKVLLVGTGAGLSLGVIAFTY